MDGEKPFIEQMKENVPTGEDVQNTVSDGVKNFGESLTEMKENVQENLDSFSNKSVVDASSEFLDSNSLLAKFAFIVLIVILFMILLKVIMMIMGYFLSPAANPYLIKGALAGSDRQIIAQDPSDDEAKQVFKSNDRHRGLEFTWSVWLYLVEDTTGGLRNVFVKGNENFDTTDKINLLNGPGLYLESKDTPDIGNNQTNIKEYTMKVVMDHISNESPSGTDSGRDTLKIDSIPIRKWVHVAIRMQNTVLDVYVNGTIAKRHNMDYAPKQNFNNVVVCGNGGFSGKLSDLRYYSYALNVFQISNIVMFGPDTRPSKLSMDSRAKSGSYSYLSNMWYSER